MEPSTKTVVGLFEQNELNVSKLYALYAEKIPNYKDFWTRLSQEEIGHANQIKNTYEGRDDEFNNSDIALDTIRQFMEPVEMEIQNAETTPISHIDALNNAFRIEQSILEKNFFEVFVSGDNIVKSLVERLGRDNETHSKLLREEIERTRQELGI